LSGGIGKGAGAMSGGARHGPGQVTADATFAATTSNTLTSTGRFSWQAVITLTVRCVWRPVLQPELKVWLVVKGAPMLNPQAQ
jgi:hypothetical protein